MICEEATPDDARLIAEAPDLLQAAELALLLWGQLPGSAGLGEINLAHRRLRPASSHQPGRRGE